MISINGVWCSLGPISCKRVPGVYNTNLMIRSYIDICLGKRIKCYHKLFLYVYSIKDLIFFLAVLLLFNKTITSRWAGMKLQGRLMDLATAWDIPSTHDDKASPWTWIIKHSLCTWHRPGPIQKLGWLVCALCEIKFRLSS